MALFSMRYLASSPLQMDRDTQAILHDAISGYYGLLDYAIISWQRHVEVVFEKQNHTSTNLIIDLRTSLESVLETYSSNVDQCSASAEHPAANDSAISKERYRAYTERLEERCSSVRKVIETIKPQSLRIPERKGFLALNGSLTFKCPKSQCSMFCDGFPDRVTREQHVKDHDIQFFCPLDNCLRHNLGFTSRNDLREHTKTSHPPETGTQYVFPSPSKRKSDIWSACASGNLIDVKQFAAEGVDLKVSKSGMGRGGLTPIVLAARNAHFAVCEYLVSQGCRIFDARQRGAPALTAAGEVIKAGSLERFRKVVKLGTEAERHAFVQGPFLHGHIAAAINFGCREVLDVVLSWESERQDRLELNDILVSACCTHGVDHRAIDNYEYIWGLLDDKSKHDLFSKTDVKLAFYGHTKQKHNVFHTSCFHDNVAATSLCLRYMTREQLNHRNSDQQTPLALGIERISAENLSFSARALKLLIESSEAVDFSALDSNGSNALHLICDQPTKGVPLEVFHLLLIRTRRLINVQDEAGDTPLHIAVRGGRLEFISMLLETADCDLSIKNKKGKTVFEVEKNRNAQEIDTLLCLTQLKG